MFLMHYAIPLIIYLFNTDKTMLIGLLLGNIIDLDHIYARIIGKIGWKESVIKKYGKSAIFGFYPLHNYKVMVILIIVASATFPTFFVFKSFQIVWWVIIGAISNQVLDIVAKHTGFMI